MHTLNIRHKELFRPAKLPSFELSPSLNNFKPAEDPFCTLCRAVLYDVQNSSQTLAQIAAKYGLPKGSCSMISKWVKKYSSDFSAMEDLQPTTSNANPLFPRAKNSGEKELQKQLEEARRKIICLETMIDIAEREIGVDIRKKSGTKQ